MEFLLFWLVFCGVAAAIAGNKGRSAVGFFLLSVIISPLLGILIALVVKPNTEAVEQAKLQTGDTKKCPFCAELIKSEASVCRYCGREMPMRSAVGKLSLGGPASARQRDERAKVALSLPASARIGPQRPLPEKVPVKQVIDLYLYLDEQQKGPFSLLEIQEMFGCGRIDEGTNYWKEGMPDWRPVTEII